MFFQIKDSKVPTGYKKTVCTKLAYLQVPKPVTIMLLIFF